jgi:hypothetical protein
MTRKHLAPLLGAGREVSRKSAAKMKEKKMDLSKYRGSRFLKVDDLRKRPLRKIIASIEEGAYQKPVATFTDGTKLSLNATNTDTLIDLFGSTESADLIDKAIELYVGPMKYQGNVQDGVALRLPAQAALQFDGGPKPKPSKRQQTPHDDDLDKPINM